MLHVFCDFDGTITEPDTLRFLTERLGAGPEHFRETGRLLRDGALSHREAIARDVGGEPLGEVGRRDRTAPFSRWP